MANFAIATQILNDGPRNTVSKTTGDVAIGALPSSVTILDPSVLSGINPGMSGAGNATLLRIDHIDYSITDGVIVQLLWDATTPIAVCELFGRGKLEAKMFGGYQNNAGAGVTGKILLSAIASGAEAPTQASFMLVLATVKYRSIASGGA